MIDIECRTVKGRIPSKATGLDVECSLEKGLICKSKNGRKQCEDFEIRVKCECGKLHFKFNLIVFLFYLIQW